MKNYTIRGGISRRINMALTSGKAKQYEAVRKAKGDSEANVIKSDAARDLKKRRQSQAEKDLAPEKKRAEQLYKERNKARQQYEKEQKRLRKKFG